MELKPYSNLEQSRLDAIDFRACLMRIGLEYLITNGNFLDVGCGDGKLIKEIQKLYPSAKLFGIDSDSDAISLTKQNTPQANIVVGDLKAIPFQPNTFDIIFSRNILDYSWEHRDKPWVWWPATFKTEEVSRQVYRILRNNGVYYAREPMADSEVNGFANAGFTLIERHRTSQIFKK